MDRPDEDDDPTRALDDFVRRMQPPPAPAADPTDLSSLLARLAPAPAPPVEPLAPTAPMAAPTPSSAPPPRGGVLRSGQRWSADDVTDVSELRLPEVAPPPAADLDAVAAAVRGVNAAVAAERRGGTELPPLHAPALRPAHDPRLLRSWQPGAWTAAQCQVFDEVTEFAGTPDAPVVETWPAQRLLALWPPQRLDQPLLGRWPERVVLAALPAEAAGAALLATLPEDATLWFDDAADIDWALLAELVLHHQPALRPYQMQGLRRFIEAQREAVFARLNDGYALAADGLSVTRRPAR